MYWAKFQGILWLLHAPGLPAMPSTWSLLAGCKWCALKCCEIWQARRSTRHHPRSLPSSPQAVMPLTGQTGFLGVPHMLGQPHRAPSLPALNTQMLMASATSQAALNNMAARAAVTPTPGPHFARQVQVSQ